MGVDVMVNVSDIVANALEGGIIVNDMVVVIISIKHHNRNLFL